MGTKKGAPKLRSTAMAILSPGEHVPSFVGGVYLRKNTCGVEPWR